MVIKGEESSKSYILIIFIQKLMEYMHSLQLYYENTVIAMQRIKVQGQPLFSLSLKLAGVF